MKNILLRTLLTVVFSVFFTILIFADTNIKVVRPKSDLDLRNHYYIDMLNLALEKTKAKYGAANIEYVNVVISQSRVAYLLAEGSPDIDVMWTMTSKERENSMLPVRIPLLKGLMGYRIFIINKKDKVKFEKIKTVEEIKKLTAVQGHDWPDSEILKANGFAVNGAPNYDGMFIMVHLGRADYFPRAVNEPYDEIEVRPALNIMVEETLMLYYPAPNFFFVNIKKPELQKRIEEGLRMAKADGSFDKLFYSHQSNKEIFSRANFGKRKIFTLENPLLTEETKKVLRQKDMIY